MPQKTAEDCLMLCTSGDNDVISSFHDVGQGNANLLSRVRR